MSQHQALSTMEIDSLMSTNVIGYQQDLIKKLTLKYNAVGVQPLKNEDVGQANYIFRELLKTAEVEVRSLLAMSLSHNENLPVELAQMIVKDVSAVASPMLEYSNVLSDENLIEIIGQESSAAKLEAIARRASVSETVSDALIETRIESVVQAVVKNEGAAIAEDTFMRIAERHSDSESLMGSLLQRSTVPAPIVDQVIKHVSESMKKTLELKYGNLEGY